MPTIHLLIKGKVQGVFYRASARKVALALDLRGWVKNTAEGHVESVATGSGNAVQQFVEWCQRGPESAVVDSVAVTALEEEEFDDFRILK